MKPSNQFYAYQGSNDYKYADYYDYDYDYDVDDYDYDSVSDGTPSAVPEIRHDRSSNVTEQEGIFNTTGASYNYSSVANCLPDEYFDEYYGGCYPYDDYYEYDYPNTLTVYDFEHVVLGYIRPALVILTTLANIFVVGYFLSSKSRGKATSLLFVSIAISDTLTGLILIPNSVYVFALEHKDLSEEWCQAYMYMRLYFSRVLHTVSIWQTVLLGMQRYICVCHPFFSGRLCTFWKTFVAICVIYVGAFTLHLYHVTDNKLGHNTCRWKTETPCMASCVYIWFCVALMHLVPCTALTYMTSKTLRGLTKARRRVSSMVPGVPSQRSARDKVITVTATLVVIVFLIPEFPYCVYRLVFVIKKHIGDPFKTFENHVFLCAYELILIISFHCNFWIYCVMMRDFRLALKRLATCGVVKRGLSRLRSFSRSSRSSVSGSVLTTVSRTSSVASRHRILSNMTSVHSVQSETALVTVPQSPTNGYAGIPSGDKDEPLVDDVFV